MNIRTLLVVSLAAFTNAQTTTATSGTESRIGSVCITLPRFDSCGPGLVCVDLACQVSSNPPSPQASGSTSTSTRTTLTQGSWTTASIVPANDKSSAGNAAAAAAAATVPPLSSTGAIAGGICAALTVALIGLLVWFYRGPRIDEDPVQEMKRVQEGEYLINTNSRHYSTFNNQ
ncbi:hypothetical protein HDU78_004424 [Chytriomyces hyalinus]|nr:hypothetical protein HDU78_004424 [Chytriomyces hyalinus]